MLKGISPLVSPDLLAALSRMGHGDELVLGDAHFPAETYAKANGAVLRDGIPHRGTAAGNRGLPGLLRR